MRQHLSRKAIVYLVTNKVNGKRYIGITSQPFYYRKTQHFSAAKSKRTNGTFYRALRKYERDDFVWSIILECDTFEVAIQHEIRLISELKPEYNSTKGGDGRLGRSLSPEARKKISEANKGSAHHSVPHSAETKARLREIGLANKDTWKKFSAMGPMALAKSVLCIDDGKIFPSASAAARNYSVSKSMIIELCSGDKRRRTAAGRTFRYLETANGLG